MDYIHIALVTTVNVGKRFYNGLNFLLFILKLCIFFLNFHDNSCSSSDVAAGICNLLVCCIFLNLMCIL